MNNKQTEGPSLKLIKKKLSPGKKNFEIILCTKSPTPLESFLWNIENYNFYWSNIFPLNLSQMSVKCLRSVQSEQRDVTVCERTAEPTLRMDCCNFKPPRSCLTPLRWPHYYLLSPSRHTQYRQADSPTLSPSSLANKWEPGQTFIFPCDILAACCSPMLKMENLQNLDGFKATYRDNLY